jgi:hypothetical protein
MDKTYVFDNAGSGFGDMSGLVASLCQQRGLDPNMVMAMMNNRGVGYGEGGWFMWIIILLIFGWGGFGGNGWGGRGNAQGFADLGNLVNNDAGRELIMSAIQGNGTAISQLATTLNCDVNALQSTLNTIQQSLCQLGNHVGLTGQQVINSIQSGDAALARQLSECCCENRLAICQQTNAIQSSINTVATGQERGFSAVAYETQRQTCDITKAIADSTAQILAGQKAAEFREIQREVQALRDERTQYQMSAMLQQQSRNLIDTIRPCPTPAFITCNPWGCNGGYYGNGYPYGSGCCCNNNGNGNCGC